MKKFLSIRYYLDFPVDLIFLLTSIFTFSSIVLSIINSSLLFALIAIFNGMISTLFLLLHFNWDKKITVQKINYKKNSNPNYKNESSQKLVFISDLHLHNFYSKKYLEEIINKINTINPKALLIGGDFVINHRTNFKNFDILKKLGDFPKIAVLGNHDFLVHDPTTKITDKNYKFSEKLKNYLQDTGITILENELYEISLKSQILRIFGLGSLLAKKCDLQKLHSKKNIDIILAHNPKIFEKIQIPNTLMLSGHNHGGQINLGKINIISLSAKIRKGYFKRKFDTFGDFISGFYENKYGSIMYLTTGIGNSAFNIRFQSNPEIVVIEIN